MGELFNTQQEYVPLIAERLIDFIRIHISQIGGLSMARKVAALCEFFGVKTAWHGPGDCSPVATPPAWHSSWPATTSESTRATSFLPETREVFPGCPETKDGYMYANEAPGLGIDIDEKLAAKYPVPRRPDLRPPLGHDPPARRHGDPAVSSRCRSSLRGSRRGCSRSPLRRPTLSSRSELMPDDLAAKLRSLAFLAALDAGLGAAGDHALLRADRAARRASGSRRWRAC